jgi:hypothetical protein
MAIFKADAEIPLEGALIVISAEFEANNLKDAIDKGTDLYKDIIHDDYKSELSVFRVEELTTEDDE